MWNLFSDQSYDTKFAALFSEIGLLEQRKLQKVPIKNINFKIFNVSAYKTASSYLFEIARILSELELTQLLTEQTQSIKTSDGRVWSTKDILYYYNGIFLDLIHQLKDKIFFIFTKNSISKIWDLVQQYYHSIQPDILWMC